MARRRMFVSAAALAAVLGALLVRATTLHSVNAAPLIYRVVSNVNDLDGVEGSAPPGRIVELWMKQRNFKEGTDDASDPFTWCRWKNDGNPVRLGVTTADAGGVWRFTNLRTSGNTVMIFPAAPGGDRCLGGLYTELLPRTCDAPGVNCSAWVKPTLRWLNVRKPTPLIGTVAGAVWGAEQASAAVADGPDDGPEPSDVFDVDQNGVDTTAPGYTVGQRIVWRCGAGGTHVCPSTTIHDSSTVISADPEYPFVLGTIQAHRTGGSFIAAAAIARGQPIGFSVNVNVKFRGRLDVNLGCDQHRFFDFSVPMTY
ncbi:MAG TPA: hypothetical protein VKA21_04710 [Candidatus Binatia bacterium]|nr:hypothetical protein [Candidatus Binatia bacterium]